MTFSKTPARSRVPQGSTKGKPGSVPANHRTLGETVKNQRVTIAVLAANQDALNAQMTRLCGTVESLAQIVASVVPALASVAAAQGAPVAAAAAAAAAPVKPQGRGRRQETVKATAQATKDAARLEALARGRATAAANREARKVVGRDTVGRKAIAAAEKVRNTATARVSSKGAAKARNAAPSVAAGVVNSPWRNQIALPRVQGGHYPVTYGATIGGLLYLAAWDREARVWRVGFGPAAKSARAIGTFKTRDLAFAALNRAAAAVKAPQVRP